MSISTMHLQSELCTFCVNVLIWRQQELGMKFTVQCNHFCLWGTHHTGIYR